MIQLLITGTPGGFVPVFNQEQKHQNPKFVGDFLSMHFRNAFVGVQVSLSEVSFPGCKSLSWIEEEEDPMEYGSGSLFVVNAFDVISQIQADMGPQIKYEMVNRGYIYPPKLLGHRYCWIFSARYCKLIDE